jgi:hypothetical protein
MGQRIRASYYCPIHNLFDVHCILAPPRYVVCPTCLKPSELCSYSVIQADDGASGVDNEDWAAFVAELMKMSGYDVETPDKIMAKGGDTNGIGRKPKQTKAVADERTKQIVDNHEMIERAKMEAALYHDGWDD